MINSLSTQNELDFALSVYDKFPEITSLRVVLSRQPTTLVPDMLTSPSPTPDNVSVIPGECRGGLLCSITFSNCGHAWIILEGGMKEGERERERERKSGRRRGIVDMR